MKEDEKNIVVEQKEADRERMKKKEKKRKKNLTGANGYYFSMRRKHVRICLAIVSINQISTKIY